MNQIGSAWEGTFGAFPGDVKTNGRSKSRTLIFFASLLHIRGLRIRVIHEGFTGVPLTYKFLPL
jgi:hypothetical protein